jgi:predicted small lipoprotein YifL
MVEDKMSNIIKNLFGWLHHAGKKGPLILPGSQMVFALNITNLQNGQFKKLL